ncbi:MAG: preprotein translocase subunit SecG [Hyphomicrobiales bacterium]|nr:MAG: preprotein translocase subunit SecG [Hyphomicrobiales bacterium]
MELVLVVIHLMVVVVLVALVLFQKSEGGALGIGGGGGGGFMSTRGSASFLTRATAFLAAAFFATSIGLTVIAKISDRPADILDSIQNSSGTSGGNTLGEGGIFGIQEPQNTEPQAPVSQ